MPRKKFHLSTPMGIARTMKEPYDYYEVFEKTDDKCAVEALLDYVKSGPKYEGQKLRLISTQFSDTASNKTVIDFIIKNGYAVPVLPGGQEIEWIRHNGNKYVLVYYVHQGGNDDPIEDNIAFNLDPAVRSDLSNLHNPNVFSILDLVPLFNAFDYDSEYKTDFLVNMKSSLYPNEYHYFTQRFNTFPDEATLVAPTDPNAETRLTYVNDSTCLYRLNVTYTSINNRAWIIPKIKNMNFAGALCIYVKCNDFVTKALGVI